MIHSLIPTPINTPLFPTFAIATQYCSTTRRSVSVGRRQTVGGSQVGISSHRTPLRPGRYRMTRGAPRTMYTIRSIRQCQHVLPGKSSNTRPAVRGDPFSRKTTYYSPVIARVGRVHKTRTPARLGFRRGSIFSTSNFRTHVATTTCTLYSVCVRRRADRSTANLPPTKRSTRTRNDPEKFPCVSQISLEQKK